MFQNKSQNIGNIIEGNKRTIEYPFTGVSSITKVEVSCGCTIADIDRVESKVKVVFVAPPVPQHLIGQPMNVLKTVTVTYTLQTAPEQEIVEMLVFHAAILSKYGFNGA